MGIVDFRSFDLNADNTLKSQRSIKHVRCIFVFHHDIPFDKTAPPNSPFCKVLFIKNVVFMKSDII